MSFRSLIIRSLCFFWRTHLGVVLGAAVGCAVLIGALAVGDSVRMSLRHQALTRLGKIDSAVHLFDRYFRQALAEDSAKATNTTIAPALEIPATALNRDTKTRANNIRLIGVNKQFWSMSQVDFDALPKIPDDGVILNRKLADHLGVSIGNLILFRLAKPSVLPRDAPLAVADDLSIALNLKVTDIIDKDRLGHFNLRPVPIAPFNAYVSLSLLQSKAELPGKINMMLAGPARQSGEMPNTLDDALNKNWQLADVELQLRALPDQNAIELRTGRIFLDENIVNAALASAPADQPTMQALTYFVDGIRSESNETPYSMIAALSPSRDGLPGPVPPDLKDDQIIVTQWLADDLKIKVGDKVTVRYFVLGESRQLTEESTSFTVAGIVPTESAGGDRQLLPDFPGLAKVDKVRNWKPGIPVDLKLIEQEDEDYWEQYRGTPKAFVSLSAGRKIWATERFGNATSIRFAYSPDGVEKIADAFQKNFKPADIGLAFEPVRAHAISASKGATDFGMLFLGLSFFLVISALILMGLLFIFSVEHRAGQIGTLMALGYTGKRVRRLLLAEGAVLATIGGLIGTAGGLGYTRVLIFGLSNPQLWGGALGSTRIEYHVTPATIAIGIVSGIGVAFITIWLAVRKLASARPIELLSSGADRAAIAPAKRRPAISLGIAGVSLMGAVALVYLFKGKQGQEAAGGFFGAGSLLLICGLSLCYALLVNLSRPSTGVWTSIGQLGIRGSSRRRGRSLATICLLACGIFLVIAVGAFRIDPTENALNAESGTGGYALMGQITNPLLYDLNTKAGQDQYNLEPEDMQGNIIVPMRQRLGDDASCLNLNQAIRPTLLGVKPQSLYGRFTFAGALAEADTTGWDLLNVELDNDTVPAVGDMNTLMWGLHVGVGDTVPADPNLFFVDESGRKFKVKIVGMLANSVLQGPLLISEKNFIKRFPSISGYKRMLVSIDNPDELMTRTDQSSLSDARTMSLSMTPADPTSIAFTIDGQQEPKLQAVADGRTLQFKTADATGHSPPQPHSVTGRVEVTYTVRRSELVRFNLMTLLSDQGLELHSATQQLTEFSKVQNTYLDIFQVLGGLGLLLGSIGLGVVVLRNILERRGELALLRAIGFAQGALRWLLLSEHWLLLILGLACGVVTAIVAVLPMLTSPGSHVPYGSMAVTAGVIVISGILWTYLAALFALRGPLIDSLRPE